jgi:hypothetical protein
MKFCKSLLIALSLFTAGSALAAEQIATLEVSIEDANLVKKDAGIRTLFIIVYDADSPRPMPYGAMKVDLKEDAKGTFYSGVLNTDNVQAMGGGSLPKNIRLKARLDKDGSAGMDATGDLTGQIDKIKLGDKAKIKISKAI